MSEIYLIGLSSIIILGVAAQWIAWRFSLPSILLLLVFGFIAGPATGFLDPELLMGNLISPIVSISVAVILFEGGMSLKIRELKTVGSAVINLITIGTVVTLACTAVASYYILGFGVDISVLLGAIFVVTGPTVIIPLLRHVRPGKGVASILRWEGIIIDSVGAMLSVLIYESIIAGGSSAASYITFGVIKTLVIGIALGILGAALIVVFLNRYWIPDFLQNSFSIMLVVMSFTISNLIQKESGLLAVTVMGIVLSNQKYADIKHIIEFKENLRVLLISSLFIILSARIKLDQILSIGMKEFLFVAALVVIVRPASVFIATINTNLKIKEKIFLSWMAPRGIVAAAIASIFSLHLAELGFSEAAQIVPVTFTVIILTVLFYGLTASPVARLLKISQSNPQGILIAGGHNWARSIAIALKKEKIHTILIDTNRENIYNARMNGIYAIYGNILSEETKNKIELEGIVRLMAITPNDEVNSLAAMEYSEIFGRSEVYQLSGDEEKEESKDIPLHMQGRKLFGKNVTYSFLAERFAAGGKIYSMKLEQEKDAEKFKKDFPKAFILFKINEDNEVIINTLDRQISLKPGHTIIYLN